MKNLGPKKVFLIFGFIIFFLLSAYIFLGQKLLCIGNSDAVRRTNDTMDAAYFYSFCKYNFAIEIDTSWLLIEKDSNKEEDLIKEIYFSADEKVKPEATVIVKIFKKQDQQLDSWIQRYKNILSKDSSVVNIKLEDRLGIKDKRQITFIQSGQPMLAYLILTRTHALALEFIDGSTGLESIAHSFYAF